ncbi:MAG TPA: DUF2892 domain-containing protein [Patescibacteria group bacterium]
MKLQCNVGETDKTIRWTVGILLLVYGFFFRSWWGLLGLPLVLTAYFGYCHLYKLLNISTCKDHPAKK